MSDLFEKELSAFVGKDGYDPKIALLESMLQGLHDRLIALERGNETKIDLEHGQSMSYENSQGAFGRFKAKPAPATVERYDSYEYCEIGGTALTGMAQYGRTLIGEVVATLDQVNMWHVVLLDGMELQLTHPRYRALVNMMLKSGAWERIV